MMKDREDTTRDADRQRENPKVKLGLTTHNAKRVDANHSQRQGMTRVYCKVMNKLPNVFISLHATRKMEM